MDAIEKRARELLAAEYEREPLRNSDMAKQIRRGVTHNTTWHALDALRAALTPPEGYVLVPVELTVEMEIAFMETWVLKRRCIDDSEMQDAWAAALAARPEVP